MAKQLVNPIERHAEKGVLGLAGLILIGAIARYGVTTPNVIEMGQDRVTPATIDAKVAQKATEVVTRLRSATPKAVVPDPLQKEFAASLQPIQHGPLAAAVAMGPEPPLVDAGAVPVGQASLVKVLTPAKPAISSGRSVLVVPAAGGGNRFVPSDWVTVSAVMDVKAQTDAQKREYGATRDELLFGPPEIQRRMRRPEGTWSEADWQTVSPWPALKFAKEPAIQLLDDGGKLIVDKDSLKEIDKFHGDLRPAKMQLDVVRFMPPDMAPPTHWRMPVIKSYRDVLVQDDEYLFPTDPPAADPVDRYGVSGEAQQHKQPTRDLTAAEQTAKHLQEAQALIASAKKDRVENDAVKAYNAAQGVFTDKDASGSDKERAKKLMAEAEQTQRDIQRLVLGNPNQPPPGPGAPPGKDAPKRVRLPVQQLWVHDAAVESLKNGETYQYRIRVRIYNQLAGAPGKFNNPRDAAVLFAASDWSDPSDPVFLEPATQFFATGDDAKNKEISAEFFQWYMGVWLKAERRIKAGIGETLRDKQRTPGPAVMDPKAVDRPEIEFAADATVVDIDFDRPVRERKPGTTPKGVKFAAPAASTGVVFMDTEGRLHERFVMVEKNHPEKREMANRLWSPPKPKQP